MELITSLPKLNVLVAYPYAKQPILDEVVPLVRAGRCRFLLDSGAFSCDTLGIKVTLDDYCRFIESLPVRPWRYFMLDVVGDPEATWNNYQKMLERGFKPIPVFTRGSDWQLIDEYYKTAEVISLGGLVSMPIGKKRAFIASAMRRIAGRKVHWLGVTNDALVKKYRPYSCDSSSVSCAERFGTLKLYAGRGRSITIGKGEFRTRPSKKVTDLLWSYGINPADLAKKSNWINSPNESCLHIRASFESYIRKSIDFEKTLGTRIFNAIATDYQAIVIAEVFKRLFHLEDIKGGDKERWTVLRV